MKTVLLLIAIGFSDPSMVDGQKKAEVTLFWQGERPTNEVVGTVCKYIAPGHCHVTELQQLLNVRGQ